MTRILAAALLVACGLVLHACGGGTDSPAAAQTAAGRVGVVLGTAAQGELRELEAQLRKALEERDQELVIQNANGDVARQAQLIQAFASQGARAIIVAPLDTLALTPAIDAAARARIPVFTAALPARGARVTTHMESDFTAAGAAAAEYLSGLLANRFRAVVIGAVGAHGTRELDAGFRTRIGADSNRLVAATLDGDGTREGAAAALGAYLQGDRPLDAVFAMDAQSALGAMDAAYAQRRADLVIVSFGATQPLLEAIGNTGPMRAALVPRLDEAGRLLADAIVTEIGGDPATASIRIPLRLVTADSVR